MNYKGVIIEESLGDKSVLQKIKIVTTKIEPITPKHKTPWLTQWTLHTIEIPEAKAQEIAEEISRSFDMDHPYWYADFKNDRYHYIIYQGKVFQVDLTDPVLYKDAKAYGVSIGIPEYQVDFAPLSKEKFPRIYKKQQKTAPGFGYWGDYGEIDIGLSSGSIPSLTHQYEEQLHAHTKGVTFFLILEGRGVIEIAGEDITVSKDDVIRIAPGERYRYKKTLDAPFRWITICTSKDPEDKIIAS